MKQSKHLAYNARRKNALIRLRAQLESGVKPSKELKGKDVPLTSKDVTRINKEIASLEGPVTKYRKKNRKHAVTAVPKAQ